MLVKLATAALGLITKGRDRGAVFGFGTCSWTCKRAGLWRHQRSMRLHSRSAVLPEILRTRAKGRRCRLRANKFSLRHCQRQLPRTISKLLPY